MSEILYNRRKFLNHHTSHYTGSIVCFDGKDIINQGRELKRYSFIEISDCHGKIRIHKDPNQSTRAFIRKIDSMLVELNLYKQYLERELDEEEKEMG